MSSFTLKLIAAAAMLIDHVGYLYFPGQIGYRMIGRLALPLFAFFITEGFRKTSDINKYLLRLFIFALLSQIPLHYAFGPDVSLNIFATLFLGLLALRLCEIFDNPLPVLPLALFAEWVNTDYGAFGVLLIFLIHHYREDFSRLLLASLFLYVAFFVVPNYRTLLAGKFNFGLIQVFALLAFPLMNIYNGERGPRLKYFFYFFYPGHLFILGYLKGIL
ncbi:MAG: TraX family protein [Bacillota bacterium]